MQAWLFGRSRALAAGFSLSSAGAGLLGLATLLGLDIEDLLEVLGQARAHQGSALGAGVTIATLDTRLLAFIEGLVFVVGGHCFSLPAFFR
jgi:hypothetical protein